MLAKGKGKMKVKTKKIYAFYKGDRFADVGDAEELASRWHISTETVKWMATPAANSRVAGSINAVTGHVIGYEPEPLIPQLRAELKRTVDRAEKLIAMGTDAYGELCVAKRILTFLDDYEKAAKAWEEI